MCLNELNSKEKFLSNPSFVPFIFPVFLTFHFYKVHDIFIYANFRGGALLVLNQIESCELSNKMDYVFISDYWFSVFSIISTKGDFTVFFGYSCQGTTGRSTSKHEAVGLFLLFPHFH